MQATCILEDHDVNKSQMKLRLVDDSRVSKSAYGAPFFDEPGAARSAPKTMLHRFVRRAIRDCRLSVLAAALAIAGCSEGAARYPQGPSIRTNPIAPWEASAARSGAVRTPQPTGVNYFGTSGDSQRLDSLWEERTHAKPFSDFPIGPGDEIVIILPSVKDLSDTSVRVSVTGDISLPLVGQIHASGMTEQQLRDEMRKRLMKFMYDPQFQLFVKQYQSRQVAVLGDVGHPGVFVLTGASETVLEAISLAGGPTPTAADRVVLIPAMPWETAPNPQTIAAVTMPTPQSVQKADPMNGDHVGDPDDASVQEIRAIGVQPPSAPKPRASSPLGALNGRPLVMALRSDSSAGSARFLNMPLRPGDVLFVPTAGQVAVVGWVYNPGSFKITSGFSALSAIGAAGGPLFAADQGDVHLLRTKNSGATESISINLDKIKRGEEPDIPVQGNDVIEVSYSKAKIVPYIFYSIVNSKVGGMYVPIP
jgi:protein involved in polysaccharide export with SLBB domain